MSTDASLRPWYLRLHWQILIGLLLGVLYGIFAASSGWREFTADWIKPFGTIFLNLLKLIAIPLVLSSLITGVASLSDVQKLSRIGGKTVVLYLATTAVAIVIGLGIVNVLRPGDSIPSDLSEKLQESYRSEAGARQEAAREAQSSRGPLQPLVDIVPSNFFGSATSNRNMLQMVFVALLVGIAMIKIRSPQTLQLYQVIEGLNEIVIRIAQLIMYTAPVGVFALIADTITSVGEDPDQILELLGALGFYCLAVALGLVLHLSIVYTSMIKFMTPLSLKRFIKAVTPVQLVAFSSSSSGATLPLTMERCQDELGVSEEVSSFVLPMGATVNMDGTALYQAVAAVFIAQALGLDLGLGAQLTIVLTALLASIGSAAVPGAGIIMLVIILEAINVPSQGIALILGVDRILDMMRTATNVTGDCAVASVVAASEGQLGDQAVD